MKAMIYGNGGGSAKVFAVIGVTYPSGSTCTCSNGTKTLTAKDTSGKEMFIIPSAGTWTVTCTDGTETATEAVTITAEGQVETVELSYDLILFIAGNKKNMASNFTTATTGSTLSDDMLIFDGDGAIYTIETVDLTDFKTLIFDVEITRINSSNYNMLLGYFSSTPNKGYGGRYQFAGGISIAYDNGNYDKTRQNYEVDVSAVYSKQYVGCGGIGAINIYGIRGKRK